MKKLFLLLLIMPCLQNVKIQAQITAKNSIYVELLGNGFIYSINYDRIIYQKANLKMSLRAGLTYRPLLDRDWQLNIPLEWNVMWGKKNNYFETGLGITNHFFFFDKKKDFQNQYITYFFFPRIGYRFQKDDKGFLFRIGLTPFVGYGTDEETQNFRFVVLPYLGISLGKSF